MGDDSTAPGSALSAVSSSQPGPVLDAQHLYGQGTPDDGRSAHPQQSYGISQQTLNTTYDMAQPQGPIRSGSYNMAALANALPQTHYRQGHFNPAQLRYNPPGPSPNVVGQAQHMPPYNGQPAMGPVPNHPYYMHQQPQMSPYYASPISSSQQSSNMSPRSNMPYYGNMTNQSHPSMGYYYTQIPPYATQGHLQHQGMPGAYIPGALPQHDPRLGEPQPVDSGDSAPFSPTQHEQRRCESRLKGLENLKSLTLL